MARAGVWGFGWVELESGGATQVCAVVVDEESELLETRVFDGADRTAEIAGLIAAVAAEIGRPRKIMVLDGAVAKALRAAGVREEIVVGRSVALEEALRVVSETVEEGPMPDFLGGDGVEVEHVRAFFTAAALLWEMEPWWLFEPGTAFGVTAAAFGVEGGGVFLMRAEDDEAAEEERGEEPGGGWMFVFSEDDLAGLGTLADGGARDQANVLAMQFDRAEAMGPELDAFLAEHDLPIAGREAVPSLSRSVRGEGMVAPSAKDYELATALCVALAKTAEDPTGQVLEIEVRTASGAWVLLEGPLDEDEDGEDEDELALGSEEDDEPGDDGWSPPAHPWIEEVDAFVANRRGVIDELGRRQIHLFCSEAAKHGWEPERWGAAELRAYVARIAENLPLVEAEVGSALDAVASWMDTIASLAGGEGEVRALVARERDALIASVMDPAAWSPQKTVVHRLRADGIDLSDPDATQDALARLMAAGELGEGDDGARTRRGRSRRPPR